MALWGKSDASDNAPKHKHILSGNVARGNVVYENTTPSAFVTNQLNGLFAVDTTEQGVTNRGQAHAGWNLVKYGTGGLATATVSANGSNFANGETVTVSNGTVNASITITSNTNGNIFSIAITNPGEGWTNNSVVTTTFDRQKHVSSITVTGGTAAFTNTDYIVVSNGSVNAHATISTNSTGGLTNSGITIDNVGLFPNGITNAQAVVNAYAANGAASNGTGATFGALLINSSGGTITLTIGGRSGRIQAETLVAMGSITSDSDDTIFPDT
jgi:hypothetical protein